MRKEAHLAALRAASKVAFSVVFIAGCSSNSDVEGGGEPTQESEIKGSCGGKKFTCEDLVKAAFPTPGEYPGEQKTVSPAVAACCTEVIISSRGASANRWDCCANHAPLANEEETTLVFAACTPWGPPVPPAMRSPRRSDAPTAIA